MFRRRFYTDSYGIHTAVVLQRDLTSADVRLMDLKKLIR